MTRSSSKRTVRRLGPLLGLALLAPPLLLRGGVGADVGASVDANRSTFTELPCPQPVPTAPGGPVVCGEVAVPLRYDGSAGMISVAVARIPAAVPTGLPPLVVLAGGPGEKLVRPALAGVAASLAEAADPTEPAGPAGGFVSLASRRDVLFVDQRGVGLSRPALECPEVQQALATSTADTVIDGAVGAYAACRQRLTAASIELDAFNTLANVADLDRVRRALGYERMALFGTSYGARLALQVARHHGDGLSRLVLSSAIPAEANFIHDVGPSFDRALQELDGACSLSPSCAATVPGLLETLERTLRRLDTDPATVTAFDPSTGAETTRTVGAFTLSSVVYSLFYVPGGPQVIPAVVASAARGDYRFLVGVPPPRTMSPSPPMSMSSPMSLSLSTASPFEQELPEGPISLGMQASFLCAEEAAHRPPAGSQPGATYAAQLITTHSPIVGPGLAALCATWAVSPAPVEVFEPVRTDVPTLVVAGRFDQITPPAYGRAVADALPNSVFVQAEAAGHSPLFGAGLCGVSVLDDFLTDDWQHVDTSCLATTPALPPD